MKDQIINVQYIVADLPCSMKYGFTMNYEIYTEK